MYLLHRKKIDSYANISLFLSYSEATVATRSGPYPAQMVTAVTAPRDKFRQPLHPLQPWTSAESRSPRDRSPARTPSPRQPSGKDHWNQLSPYNLTLLQLEQTAGSSGQRRTGPPTEPGSSQGFFSVLSPMEFWFLPLSPLAYLVGDTSFPAISSTW